MIYSVRNALFYGNADTEVRMEKLYYNVSCLKEGEALWDK